MEAVRAVGVISVLSIAVMLQFFAAAGRLGPLLAAPPAALLTQALVRGYLQGVIGVSA